MTVVLIVSMLVSFWVGEPGSVISEDALANAYQAVNDIGQQAAEFLSEYV